MMWPRPSCFWRWRKRPPPPRSPSMAAISRRACGRAISGGQPLARDSNVEQEIEVETHSPTSKRIGIAIASIIADWQATAAREDSEPSTGEGRKELAAKAQGIEKHRDERNAAKETYEFASGALELGILLASSSIVTGLLPLAFV